MDIALGVLLLALTTYTSTLAYALRSFSRSRLADALADDRKPVWFDRLDRTEVELQTLGATLRMLAILGLCVFLLGQVPTWQPTWSLQSTQILSFIVCGVALVLFAVGIPFSVARYGGERFLAANLGVIWFGRIALLPLVKVLGATDFVVRRLLGVTDDEETEQSDRHEQEILDAVQEGELRGAVDEDQAEIIESVFELTDTPVTAIMTPRTDTVAIPLTASADEVRATIVDAGHSRIPVFEETLDNIIGVLYAKDLLQLRNGDALDIRRLMREVPYVPETKTIDSLLRELRQSKVHIAIVLDEYGGTAGLVTIEDILEELVGEIDDEYDQESAPNIERIDSDTLEVDGRVHVHDVNEELSIELPDNGDYETIGGFVFSSLGKIPATGEQFDHENIHINVLDAEPRKIKRLRISVRREARSA